LKLEAEWQVKQDEIGRKIEIDPKRAS